MLKLKNLKFLNIFVLILFFARLGLAQSNPYFNSSDFLYYLTPDEDGSFKVNNLSFNRESINSSISQKSYILFVPKEMKENLKHWIQTSSLQYETYNPIQFLYGINRKAEKALSKDFSLKIDENFQNTASFFASGEVDKDFNYKNLNKWKGFYFGFEWQKTKTSFSIGTIKYSCVNSLAESNHICPEYLRDNEPKTILRFQSWSYFLQ